MMKNAFYFILKAHFVLRMFKVLSSFFGHVRKGVDKKAKANFKIYDVADWQANSYNTYIVQHLKSKGNQTMKFGQLIEYDMRSVLHKNHTESKVGRLLPGTELITQTAELVLSIYIYMIYIYIYIYIIYIIYIYIIYYQIWKNSN